MEERRGGGIDGIGGLAWLMGLILTLLAPMVVELFGWNDPWLVIIPSALIGALCLWNINASYSVWIEERRKVGRWLSYNLPLAGLGVAVVSVAALLMAWSSRNNVQAGIAYALGLWLAGMVPVVRVVRARLDEIAGEFPPVLAWPLNAVFIAGATVLPAGLLTGFESSGVTLGLIAGGVWLAFEVAGRLLRDTPLTWLVAVGAVCMLTPIVVVLVADADADVLRWPLLLLFPLGLALVSARQRSDQPVTLASVNHVWTTAAGVGAVLLVVGFIAWWVVLDDVSPVFLVGGALGAVLFGASLVTRGEGLVVVVLVGLLMVWVVQDHTGGPAPLAPVDAENVLASFGDSYLSGEGIGTFYENTNTAGERDLSIEGVNECRRSEHAFSPRVAEVRGLELAFYGCSGALATSGGFDLADPTPEATENSVYGQLLRWEAERGTTNDPELVLLSLGGNDAGFATIGGACFLPGSCDNALDASATPALAEVAVRVQNAIEKARAVFPSSPMVVVAYPQMFGPDIDRCAGQLPFNATETRALQGFVDALNTAVGAAVAEGGGDQVVHFTGAAAAYDGERFCELDADGGGLVEPRAIQALSFQPTEGDDLLDRLNPSKIIHNTFHPTGRGHELVAAALVEFLDADCHLGARTQQCEQATAPVGSAPVMEPDALPDAEQAEQEPEADDAEPEVVEGAPIGGCNDLDTFNECTILQSLRLVLVQLVMLGLAGVLLMFAARRGDLVGWLGRRLPGLGRAFDLTPLRDHTE